MGPTESRVRGAAIELFAERGFHAIGIRDLAERAGLSSATLYHYMGTKEELLASIMRDSLQRLATAGDRLTATGSPRERITALVHLHVLTHAERRLETRVVDDEMRALSEGPRAEIIALRDRYEHHWRAAIEAGVADGTFHVAQPRLARLALLEMCSGIARWYEPNGPIGLDDLATHHAAMALALLGAPASSDTTAIPAVRAVVSEIWPPLKG